MEILHLFLLVFNPLSLHDKLRGLCVFQSEEVPLLISQTCLPNPHILPFFPSSFHDCVPLPVPGEGKREKQTSVCCIREVSNTERTVWFHSHYSDLGAGSLREAGSPWCKLSSSLICQDVEMLNLQLPRYFFSLKKFLFQASSIFHLSWKSQIRTCCTFISLSFI